MIAVAALGKTKIISLTFELALAAADISLTHKIPMADAIIYATATENKAKLITSDSHLKNLPNVMFIEK